MEVFFSDYALKELYELGKTKDSKYKFLCRNRKLVEGYQRAVSIMYDVESTEALKAFSFLRYEKLKYQGDSPKSSLRLVNGMVERLIFTESEEGIEVELIKIDSTHYGNKK
jgi:plasmid maintenance system killer protein